jgi:hypothetical protein
MTLPSYGTALQRLPVEIVRVRTLEYFEGDRIIECKSSTGDPFVQIWFDLEDDVTRWLLVRTTSVNVSQFLARWLSLRDLILQAPDGFVYVVDYDDNDQPHRVFLADPLTLPADELPTTESLHDPRLVPHCTTNGTIVVLLDGGRWDVPRISLLDRRFKDVCAGHSVLGSRPEPASKALDGLVSGYRFKGGWVHVTTFDKISGLAPANEIPNANALQYASPGFVRYEVEPDAADRVREAVRYFGENRKELQKRNADLYSTLREFTKARDGDAENKVIASLERSLKQFVDRLLAILPQLDQEKVWRVGGGQVEPVAQVLAGFFRRYRDLDKLVNGDDATLV